MYYYSLILIIMICFTVSLLPLAVRPANLQFRLAFGHAWNFERKCVSVECFELFILLLYLFPFHYSVLKSKCLFLVQLLITVFVFL